MFQWGQRTIGPAPVGAAGLATVPTGAEVWVDAVNGSDATGTLGDRNAPYATIQAAVTAYAAVGGTYALHVGPGLYAEDVVIPVLADASSLDVIGHGATLRSLTVTPSTLAESMWLDITGLDLGTIGPQTVSPLNILGDLGNATVSFRDGTITPATNAIDAITIAAAGAGTTSLVLEHGSAGDPSHTVTPSTGLALGKGSVVANDFNFYGTAVAGIDITGASVLDLAGGGVEGSGAGIGAIATAAAGTVTAQGTAFVVDAAGTGPLISGAGAATVTLGAVRYARANGTGQINVPNATVVYGFVEVDDGAALTVTAALQLDSPVRAATVTAAAVTVGGVPVLPYVVTAVQTMLADYNASIGELVRVDPSGITGFAVLLPTAVGNAGQSVTVWEDVGDLNIITVGVQVGGELINGAATQNISGAYNQATFVSNGVGWRMAPAA